MFFQMAQGPPGFGSNVRIEIGASNIQAQEKQSSMGVFGGGTSNVITLVGQSAATDSWVCGPPCDTTLTLRSSYASWERVNTTSDFILGGLTFAPAVIVFGGDSRNTQDFSQLFTINTNPQTD
jgi:hypothetical protein